MQSSDSSSVHGTALSKMDGSLSGSLPLIEAALDGDPLQPPSVLEEKGNPTGCELGKCTTEGNPQFTLWNRSVADQFKVLLADFLRVEVATMNRKNHRCTVSLQNTGKNRYLDILANDETLFPGVKLTPPLTQSQGSKHALDNNSAEPSTHAPTKVVTSLPASPPPYINGNLIQLGIHPVFVASQAPTPSCMVDFYATIWRYKISLILMLTQLMENNIPKADIYWPDGTSPSQKFGNIIVSLDPDRPYYTDPHCPEILCRPLVLTRVGRPEIEPLKVLHVQYIGWPDHGTPISGYAFGVLLDYIDGYKLRAPVIVHCSAGIGRTGTLIGTFAALCRARKGTLADTTLTSLLIKMRECRYGMVQRVEQFLFMYQVLLQRLGIDTEEFVAALPAEVERYIAAMQSETRQPRNVR